jgi:hypothetical protein
LEFSVGCVIQQARLIPLSELAKFAAELGAYDRVSTYLAEAHSLTSGPAELHDLHTVTGIFALSTGKMAEARKCLAESIRVRREDDFAFLVCGAAHALNLMLGENSL